MNLKECFDLGTRFMVILYNGGKSIFGHSHSLCRRGTSFGFATMHVVL